MTWECFYCHETFTEPSEYCFDIPVVDSDKYGNCGCEIRAMLERNKKWEETHNGK